MREELERLKLAIADGDLPLAGRLVNDAMRLVQDFGYRIATRPLSLADLPVIVDWLTEQGGEVVDCPRCYGLGWVNELYTDDIVADDIRQVPCSLCRRSKRVLAFPVLRGA